MLIGCAVFAHAQTATEPERLVRLNVVAVDASGQPASGLTAADFQIADQGKAQSIALFRGAGLPPATVPFHANRPVSGAHTTAILFDFLEENRAERLDASKKMAASLKRLDPGESLYLYVLAPDGQLVPLHEMKDPAAPPDKTWLGDIDKLLAGAIKSQNKDRPMGMGNEDVVKKAYVALETLGNQLAAFPGRREIVWVTNAVPYVMNPQIQCKADWWDCALYVPHLTVTLERAGVAVDPFSYTSLDVNTSRTMEELAGLTGGRAYLNQDLGDVIQQFGKQGEGTYSIAWAPPASNWDSKFHRLKLTCERKGVKLLARDHYYALPDQRATAMRRQAFMVAAYQSSADVSDIGFRAALSPGSSPNTLKVEVRIDPADLVLSEKQGQATGGITLLFSARSANGPQGEPTLADLDFTLTPEMRAAASKDGIAVSRQYPIDGATRVVRLIVADRATDAVGSLTIPVQ